MNIEQAEVGKKVTYRREGAVITEVDRLKERVWIAPSLPLKEHQKEVPVRELTAEPK